MAVIRQAMGEALVCGFTRADGMWQLVAVTSADSPGSPSFLITKTHGQEPLVTIYYTTEACDHEFIRVVDECMLDGYEPHGQVVVPLTPMDWDPVAERGFAGVEKWANKLLRSASFEIEHQVW